MYEIFSKVTNETNFYKGNDPIKLLNSFGSPLYVYNEKILRDRINDMKNLVTYPNFKVNYSPKANTNVAIMQIVKSEGLDVDAMSPGEIFLEQKAGFPSERILFICNNVSSEEMKYALDRNILISADSLSQLEQLGKLNYGGSVAVRINPGVGAGHHEKVVTGGKKTKFGINNDKVPEIKSLLKKYNLKLSGINMHIGSLFMEGTPYIEGVKSLLETARNFDNLDFIDTGGGFGIPYNKTNGEQRLDLHSLGSRLDTIFNDFAIEYGKQITFKIEPGRYISAECGVLLGTVYAIKENEGTKYIGTDIGMNAILRPSMYDSHHDIEVYRASNISSTELETVTIVGNICESGDILSKKITLPEIYEGDVIGVLDAGAYGHSMCSNYNSRLRPAEVLIKENGEVVLIRNRDTYEDIFSKYLLL